MQSKPTRRAKLPDLSSSVANVGGLAQDARMAPQTLGLGTNGVRYLAAGAAVVEGKCVTVRVSLVGQVVLWVASIGLMGMGTFGNVDDAKGWALLLAAAAASWTIISVLARQHHLMVKAFELGRAVGERSMHSVP